MNKYLLTGLIIVLFAGCQSKQAVITEPAHTETVFKNDLLDAQGVHLDYARIQPPVKLEMSAAVGYQAEPETMARVEESISQFAQLLWQATYGNMQVANVRLRNNSQDGYIHFEKLEKLGGHAQFGGPFTVNTNLLDLDKKTGKAGMGVKVLGAGILHEFGHSMLRLKDEYGTTRKCIMHPQSRKTYFCASCRQELLERFPGWRFPPETEREKWAEQHPAPPFQMDGTR